MKVFITQEELNAIQSLVDLAAASVSDAEYEHGQVHGVSRRNGGYSSDLRIAIKRLDKMQNAFDLFNKRKQQYENI